MKKNLIVALSLILTLILAVSCNAPQNTPEEADASAESSAQEAGMETEETDAHPNNEDLIGEGIGMDLGFGPMNYDIVTMRERLRQNGYEDLFIVGQMEQVDEPWNTLWKNGLEELCAELDIELQINDAGSDATVEAQQIDNAINLGVDGILLFPANDEQAVPIVQESFNEGVPVVGAFIIPDAAVGDGASNVDRGRMAANKILEQFEEMGEIPVCVVADLPFYYGILTQRQEGFVEVMLQAEEEGRAVLLEEQYILEDNNEAWMQTTLDVLATNPEINVIFATYGSPTISCAAAVKDSGLDVKVYGVDADAAMCQLVKDGDIEALHPYDAKSNAYCALFTLMRLINGDENVPNFAEPELYQQMWLTKDNVDEYAEKALGATLE